MYKINKVKEIMQTEKNRLISNSSKQTRLKRKDQVCRTFTVKIHASSMNKTQKQYLEKLFREAKWWYNWVLAMSKQESDKYDLAHFWSGFKEITHRDKSGQDIQVSLFLPAVIKQAITERMFDSIKGLSILKKRGHQQPGQLKFKSSIQSIPLKQLNNSHKINLFQSCIKLIKCKKPFKVRGLDQIPIDIEYVNAKLIRKPDGYYIALTTYLDKDKVQSKQSNGQTIGIDFGCQTSFTLSNRQKYNAVVKEPERLKRLQRKLSKKQKNSNSYCKTKKLLSVEYQKMVNRKQDLTNKLVAEFCKYDTVIIQDEQLQNWHKTKYISKKVQHSVLGRVKSKLISKDNVVVLSKWLPSTKLCTSCGSTVNLKLSDRIFKCSCGVSMDRDVHAAQTLLWMYKHNIGVGCTEFKRGEIQDQIKRAICKYSLSESLKHEGSTL